MRNLLLGVVAVGLMGSILGCSKAHTDDSISNEIKANMFSDPQTKSANVSVDVKNGTVTLTGEVPDENTRYEAFKIAKQTAGVVNVDDQMSLVQSPAAASAQRAANREPAANPKRASKREREHDQQQEALVRRPLAGSVDNSPYGATSGGQDFAQQQPAAPQPTSAAAPAAPSAPAAPEPPAAPAVRHVDIPGGTPVHLQMIDSVDSAKNHAGDIFHASLALPITVNGEPIVPSGTDIYVKLVTSSSAGHLAGRSELTLQLARLDFQGASYNLSSDDYHDVGKSRGARTAETVGAGAAIGAVIGGILGHGKGAAIGAASGGAGGVAVEEATKSPQVRIASETKLDFTLQQPVTLSYTQAP